MSVYNGMPFLPEAVDSIFNQTLQDFKFLIINDGSTDGSLSYLKQIDDPRVYIAHQKNRGLSAALNQGLKMCDTEFLARMDADDIASPTRLEALLSYLRAHKNIGLVGTQIAYIGVSGRKGFSPPLPIEHANIYGDLLRMRYSLCHGSIMCRTRILKDIGGYRIQSSGEDVDIFLRMGEASRLANLDKVLYLVRLNRNSLMSTQLNEIRRQGAYARHCAQRRAKGIPEISFNDFIVDQQIRPFWQRAAEAMDIYALTHYRLAMADILDSSFAKGYARLVWAALSSPQWTFQRIYRALRKVRGL
jgi:glycosyltransferase involved in cell wall biosynthesis